VASESGIIVFNITTAQLHKKARLEVLLDDAYWPAFTTSMARSRNVTWDYTGEGFIKELDFGRVWLRLNEADEGTKDDIIAEWKEDAKKFLQEAMVCLMSLRSMRDIDLIRLTGRHRQANAVSSRWAVNC
jgi:Ca2+-dependent lipid-binding protein